MKVLSALNRLQKSPNKFIPVHMHLGPRTRSSQVSLWNLPEELILCILKSLHIKDLLSMRAVNSSFRDIIDGCSTLWNTASFLDTWPSSNNIQHFEKASEFGNIEALIKMAIAYLYNEGLPGDFEGRKVTSNGIKAAELFCQIESMTPFEPFTWLFIRPPWSINGACCKECVFTYMKNYLQENDKQDTKNVNVCVAKTLLLLDDEEQVAESDVFLNNASQLGSGSAAFLLWQKQYQDCMVTDRARKLESIRQLREIAKMNNLDSKLSLCKMYANEMYGGITKSQAAMFVRELVQSTTPSNTQECFRTSQELTTSMRYILVDWLVEIAGMKDFSSHTLHIAVSVVDRYLKIHKTSRSKLQLLGVSAMVLCSRFLGKDIITIREAAWLTDNTYKYEDVVRMMGEISATLRGNIRVPNSLDFVEIFSSVAGLDRKCSCLAEYICELTLLQAEMGQYSPAEIAASCVLLARLLMKLEMPWPDKIVEFSGFSIEDISRCAFHMHEKCFLEGSVVDHRDVKLQAVKLRYAEEKFYKVSEIPIMSYEELCAMLGVTEHILQGSDVCVKFRNADELILSPSRKKRKCERIYPHLQDRENAATPSIEDNSVIMDESVMSGYFGDQEDEEDSFQEYDDSSEDHGSPSDLECGSESDTYFASISKSDKSKEMPFNLSFSTISSEKIIHSSPKKSCDHESSSGISSSPNTATDNSPSCSYAFVPKSPLGISGHSSHIWTLNSAKKSCVSSDSEMSSPRCSEKQGATSYMTLRRTTKRKSRHSLCYSASFSGQQ
ncbi:cyclin-F-like isoform X2 [Saccostrea echinata]|uniref:cyclin-F-like isoform X2 n=1 Tax=Saccostrea echinata TaxID=191078 RepID=UPI002A840156|nr:cyclin-F-like isoform X2 [Saccostrea echinata]